MTVADVARTLRKVSGLRSVCLRLPHLPTPAEAGLLQRFEAIVTAPARATAGDVDVIAAGWHRWWRAGKHVELLEMELRLPSDVIDSGSKLLLLAQAARLRRWLELQEQIEVCKVCLGKEPHEISTPLRRDEIPLPPSRIEVLFVGVAPTRLTGQSGGRHFYSDQNDRLRTSLFGALDKSSFKTDLVAANKRGKENADWAFHQAGFFFVHAGKVRPTKRDAPPTSVLKTCALVHLLAEIRLLQPEVVCLLGNTPGHLPDVARVLFNIEIGDVPEPVSLDSWTGLATVTTQPRRGGVPRAQRTLEAVWQALSAVDGRR